MGLQHESVLVFIRGFIMAVKNSLISGCMSFLIEFLNLLTADTLCAKQEIIISNNNTVLSFQPVFLPFLLGIHYTFYVTFKSFALLLLKCDLVFLRKEPHLQCI